MKIMSDIEYTKRMHDKYKLGYNDGLLKIRDTILSFMPTKKSKLEMEKIMSNILDMLFK